MPKTIQQLTAGSPSRTSLIPIWEANQTVHTALANLGATHDHDIQNTVTVRARNDFGVLAETPTGTVSGVINETTITGTDTNFYNSLMVGDVVFMDVQTGGLNKVAVQVAEILSDTEFTYVQAPVNYAGLFERWTSNPLTFTGDLYSILSTTPANSAHPGVFVDKEGIYFGSGGTSAANATTSLTSTTIQFANKVAIDGKTLVDRGIGLVCASSSRYKIPVTTGSYLHLADASGIRIQVQCVYAKTLSSNYTQLSGGGYDTDINYLTMGPDTIPDGSVNANTAVLLRCSANAANDVTHLTTIKGFIDVPANAIRASYTTQVTSNVTYPVYALTWANTGANVTYGTLPANGTIYLDDEYKTPANATTYNIEF